MNSSFHPTAMPGLRTMLSYKELAALAEIICMLPIDRLAKVVEFVRQAGGTVTANGEELVIDFDTLHPSALRALQSCVRKWECTVGSGGGVPAGLSVTIQSTPLAAPPPPPAEAISRGEREALAMAIQSLPSGYFAKLVELMCAKERMLVDGKGNLLVNFEALQPATLRAMQAYVQWAYQQIGRDCVNTRL
jgi:Bromodomain extra-terminal - transcription regulation